MSFEENYSKVGCALLNISTRLRDVLGDIDDSPISNSITSSWRTDATQQHVDTAGKFKDFLAMLQQDKAEGTLQITVEVHRVLQDIRDLVGEPPKAEPPMAESPKAEPSKAEPLELPSGPKEVTTEFMSPKSLRDMSSCHSPKRALSARCCVVCYRDDRPGEQRKSGFKCNECIGRPSNLERRPVSFTVQEIKGHKKVVCGQKSIEEYDLGDSLGAGSYGKVKTCTHKKSGQKYAMKILDKRRLEKIRKPGSDTSEFDKVMTEIGIMKSLHHPNVVKMYEVIDDPDSGKVYLIMEFCGRGRIFDLEGQQEGLSAKEIERFKKYVVAIANGLEYLHSRNIYHRDLKPDNILLDANDHVKITDFGVSTITGENDVLTQTEGTPAFNAPEEFSCEKMAVAGDKADIWSFGVTVFVMAFGSLPFHGQNINELGDAILNNEPTYPDWADDLLVNLLREFLEKDPVKRITLRGVLDHTFLEDVRTVKGQAVETITCEIRTAVKEELDLLDLSGAAQICDGILIVVDKTSKGIMALNDYINTKGGMYQVVLPTPDSCTLFRPRGHRGISRCQTRDVSFSFLGEVPGRNSSARENRKLPARDCEDSLFDDPDPVQYQRVQSKYGDRTIRYSGSTDRMLSIVTPDEQKQSSMDVSQGYDLRSDEEMAQHGSTSTGDDLLDSLGITINIF